MGKEEDIYGDESAEPVKTVTEISKCPNCGANLEFMPETQTLKCPFCGTEMGIDARKTEEHNFSELISSGEQWVGTHVFRCENCGAQQVLSSNDIAVACSFCGTTNVVETQEMAGTKPTAVVPFKIGKDAAADIAAKWVKKKIFAPSDFKKSAKPENIKGVYNPAFTFDTETSSYYSGKLGRRKTRTVRINGKTVTQSYTEYFNISGKYDKFFDDILIQASSVIDQKTVNKIKPFMTNESRSYTEDFLHGFTANRYSKDGKQCWEEAKKIIYNNLKSEILSRYPHDIVVSFSLNTNCNEIKYKYVLIPLYVGHYGWKQKLYNFFINGFSGKIAGKTPVSAAKVGLTVLIALAALAGLGALLYFLSPLIDSAEIDGAVRFIGTGGY